MERLRSCILRVISAWLGNCTPWRYINRERFNYYEVNIVELQFRLFVLSASGFDWKLQIEKKKQSIGYVDQNDIFYTLMKLTRFLECFLKK